MSNSIFNYTKFKSFEFRIRNERQIDGIREKVNIELNRYIIKRGKKDK